MTVRTGLRFLAAYARSRRLDRLTDRETLERYQQRWLENMIHHVTRHSPYYGALAQIPFAQWPIIDKSTWMGRFDEINTAGARLDELNAIATRHEGTRDFSPTWRELTVGLSTGTSGSRGLFLVSPTERAQWAGTLLGKMLRSGLLARERIALVLRAGSTLYDTVAALRLRFRFFDQARPWSDVVNDLEEFSPTILVAPARVLRLLATSRPTLRPQRIISVAEVLDDLDRARIEGTFGVEVEQIYQATEGLLATSCERGALHLNEPYVLVEKHWLDAERLRFTPIVTDLWRRTQPVIRYRMNDVIRVAQQQCPCGRAALTVAAIEGRLDDVLWLRSQDAEVPVFPDLLARTVVNALPAVEDYEIVETARGRWRINLRPLPPSAAQEHLLEHIQTLTRALGATQPQIDIAALGPSVTSTKQRRIRGMGAQACAS